MLSNLFIKNLDMYKLVVEEQTRCGEFWAVENKLAGVGESESSLTLEKVNE